MRFIGAAGVRLANTGAAGVRVIAVVGVRIRREMKNCNRLKRKWMSC